MTAVVPEQRISYERSVIHLAVSPNPTPSDADLDALILVHFDQTTPEGLWNERRRQCAASVAACAFAPKPATQTLISADHRMGAAGWGPRYKSISVRMTGGGCRAYDVHPIDAKKRQMAGGAG